MLLTRAVLIGVDLKRVDLRSDLNLRVADWIVPLQPHISVFVEGGLRFVLLIRHDHRLLLGC